MNGTDVMDLATMLCAIAVILTIGMYIIRLILGGEDDDNE